MVYSNGMKLLHFNGFCCKDACIIYYVLYDAFTSLLNVLFSSSSGNLAKEGSNIVAFSASDESKSGYWGVIQTDGAVSNLSSIKEIVSYVVQVSMS